MSPLTSAWSRYRRGAGAVAVAMALIVAAGCGSNDKSSGSRSSGSSASQSSGNCDARAGQGGRCTGDQAADRHHGEDAGRQGHSDGQEAGVHQLRRGGLPGAGQDRRRGGLQARLDVEDDRHRRLAAADPERVRHRAAQRRRRHHPQRATRAAIAKQLKEAQAKKVAFVGCCSTEKVGPDYLYNTGTPEQSGEIGKYLAALIASDSGAKANTLYVDIPAFTILGVARHVAAEEYAKYCPGCEFAKIDVPLPRLADSHNIIVSYLRSHPKVNYVALR